MKKERSFCRFDKDFRITGRQEMKKICKFVRKGTMFINEAAMKTEYLGNDSLS